MTVGELIEYLQLQDQTCEVMLVNHLGALCQVASCSTYYGVLTLACAHREAWRELPSCKVAKQ